MNFHDHLRAIKPPATLPKPHPFEQHSDAWVHVCVCGLWPGHHVHTGDNKACSCDACRATPERVMAELQTLAATWPHPRQPQRIEMGTAAHEAMSEYGRKLAYPVTWPGDRLDQPPVAAFLYGIPVVKSETLAPHAWRLLEGDDVVQEGTLGRDRDG